MEFSVAVLTDTVSPHFYFPKWFDYYSRQFGSENIFVTTIESELSSFKAYSVGKIYSLPSFNNHLRAEHISSIAATLLESYTHVIRVDTDEFLVPDPLEYESLAAYVKVLNKTHITALGFNIIPDHEQPPLDLEKPILTSQRHLAHPYDALCKTCIISEATRWSPGFHFCSRPPQFDKVFLFHTKLADIDLQLEIGRHVASLADESRFIEYHTTPRDVLEQRLQNTLQNPRYMSTSALYRTDYIEKFISTIAYTSNTGGIYHGTSEPLFAPEAALIQLPEVFDGIF